VTDLQRSILMRLAATYLRMGRPRRALLVLLPVGDGTTDAALNRLRLRAHVAVGNFRMALELVERLVDDAFSAEDLAEAFALQARALIGLGQAEAARAAWAEYVAHCRINGIDLMDHAR
jgi:hypothetical protein